MILFIDFPSFQASLHVPLNNEKRELLTIHFPGQKKKHCLLFIYPKRKKKEGVTGFLFVIYEDFILYFNPCSYGM